MAPCLLFPKLTHSWTWQVWFFKISHASRIKSWLLTNFSLITWVSSLSSILSPLLQMLQHPGLPCWPHSHPRASALAVFPGQTFTGQSLSNSSSLSSEAVTSKRFFKKTLNYSPKSYAPFLFSLTAAELMESSVDRLFNIQAIVRFSILCSPNLNEISTRSGPHLCYSHCTPLPNWKVLNSIINEPDTPWSS